MSTLRITDHAAVRYCERVLGFDRAALGNAMADLVGPLHTGRFKIPGHDVLVVVENGTVLTFVPSGHTPGLKAKHKKNAKQKQRRLKTHGEVGPHGATLEDNPLIR